MHDLLWGKYETLRPVQIESICSKNPIAYKYIKHGQTIEIIWTIFPAVVLLIIAFPSFILLYLCDEVISPAMTIKAMAEQKRFFDKMKKEFG